MPLVSRRALYALLFLCALLRGAPAGAHGVYIFAWAEPGRICTDSYFSAKSKVRGGEVSMRDTTGELLAEGRSDMDGIACFAVPEHIRTGGPAEAEDLLFVVMAGQGHRAEFLLPAAQVEQALAPSGRAKAAPDTAPPSGSGESRPPDGPRLRDILGGLGWIAGLAGLGAWWSSRRRGR